MLDIEKATNPKYSAWISASAGTGKTKLLTDRIVNLLISGIDPKNILCITFTNAAKGEMISRINSALKNLKNLSDEDAHKKLTSLSIESSTMNINKLREIFDKYQSLESKVQIFTIHGFCQSILQRFPLEAGIKPNFSVIDEISSQLITNKIISSYEFAIKIPESLKEKLSIFYLKDLLVEYLDFYSRNSKSLSAFELSKSYFDSIRVKYRLDEIEDLKKNLSNKIQRDLKPLSNRSIPLVDIILNSEILSENLTEIFLTKESKPRKRILSKEILSEFRELEDILKNIQDDYVELYTKSEISEYIVLNKDLLNLSFELLSSYKSYKVKNNLLDYNDLIDVCYNLICSSEIKEWIKYKLDQSFDHILVDESQDTSESQWQIIKALIEDFFAGDAAKNKNQRTVFIVGDIKQSIYGFQGARPDLFIETKNNLKLKAKEAGVDYIDTILSKTYRIPSPIFKFIKNVFENSNLIEQVFELECHRSEGFSSVEIWDLEEKDTNPNLFWPTPEEVVSIENSNKRLAENIAKYIKSILDANIYIESKQRVVQPSDFMILLQKRSSLNRYLYEEIQKRSIPIAGMDRISLNDSYIVKDVISVLKYIIDPDDKLNLVHLLKSFLFLMKDEEILSSIDNILSNNTDVKNQLEYIIQHYQSSSLKDFILNLLTDFDIYNVLKNDNNAKEIDSLNSFLTYLNNIFEVDQNISITEFIEIFNSTEISIKRDFSFVNAVKINTVHGSKGLESPIIILADANYYSTSSKSRILEAEYKDVIIPLLSSTDKIEELTNIKTLNASGEYNEYLRLLYVALTRVQDHLVICGAEPLKNRTIETWYEICKNAIDESFIYEDKKYIFTYSEANLGAKQTELEIENIHYKTKERVFLRKKVEKDKYNFDSNAALRGKKVHLELENLLNEFRVNDGIHNHDFDFVLKNKKFSKFLNMKNLSEAEIISKDNNANIKILRLDFIAFDDQNKEAHIVDYKTDTNKSEKYNKKLEEYAKAVNKIYPDYKVFLYLYWLKNDEIEEVKY